MSESLPQTLSREEVKRMIKQHLDTYDSNITRRFQVMTGEIQQVRDECVTQTGKLNTVVAAATDTNAAIARVEAHGYAIYGNGTGRKGVLDIRAELDQQRWDTQLNVNKEMNRSLRVIQSTVKQLLFGKRFQEGVQSANARLGKLAFGILGGVGAGAVGLIFELLKSKFAH